MLLSVNNMAPSSNQCFYVPAMDGFSLVTMDKVKCMYAHNIYIYLADWAWTR
nr:hypothetical protein Q903MT_gene6529 [Picea sitchensis]